jgi:hypothetical protein
MPRMYPPEFRRQVIELARAGTRVKQLAATFQMSDNGDLPYVLLGKRIRFSKQDIEQYLAGCRRGPRAEL